MKLCKCGCGEYITDKDRYGRNHYYKHGHRDYSKHPIYHASGVNHYNWKGGRHLDVRGYVMVSIGGHKRRPEHDIIMEQKIGRRLRRNELVHHKNGIKHDNSIENLELLTRDTHPLEHISRDVNTGRFIQ